MADGGRPGRSHRAEEWEDWLDRGHDCMYSLICLYVLVDLSGPCSCYLMAGVRSSELSIKYKLCSIIGSIADNNWESRRHSWKFGSHDRAGRINFGRIIPFWLVCTFSRWWSACPLDGEQQLSASLSTTTQPYCNHG